jgi:hypothetical protein
MKIRQGKFEIPGYYKQEVLKQSVRLLLEKKLQRHKVIEIFVERGIWVLPPLLLKPFHFW